MAVSFKNKNSVQNVATTTSPQTITGFTVNSGTDMAIVFISWDPTTSGQVTGVSLGGISGTSCGAVANNTSDNFSVQAWWVPSPPFGTQSVVVTYGAGPTELYVNVVCFVGAHQTIPVRPSSYQSAATSFTGLTVSMTISSATTDYTVTGLNMGSEPATGTNQTLDSLNTNGNYQLGDDHCTTPASSVTHTWTNGAPNGQYAMIGFSIQPASGGGGGVDTVTETLAYSLA